MSEPKRPPLLQRLLRLSRPEEPARPKTIAVRVQRVTGTVLLPRELLVVPAGAEPPTQWYAVLEEAVFQQALRQPPSPPLLCTLAQLAQGAPGASGLALRGMQRAALHGVTPAGPAFHAEVAPAEPPAPDAAAVEPLAAELRTLGKRLLRQRPAGPFYLSAATVDALREPDALADLLAAWCDPDLETRRRVLAAVDVEARLRLVLSVVTGLLAPAGSAR